MITPIRGRKRALQDLHYCQTLYRLEMITPIRGRKRGVEYPPGVEIVIRNDNPDKGTETGLCDSFTYRFSVIRNDNPDKVTETFHLRLCIRYHLKQIRNDNPDKGTETDIPFSSHNPRSYRLEMITPIRGRKPSSTLLAVGSPVTIRNDNPDKGTET